MNRAEDLRADYDRLGELLQEAEGAAAAAIARERRLIGEKLELIEKSDMGVALVDELATRRSGVGRPPSRRRQSG